MREHPLQKNHIHHTHCDLLFRYAEFLGFGELHVKFDHATGLRAIVAIHNLKRGPAIGGCRLLHYATTDDAIEDAMRLGYMMSLKSAINNLPHGGAKAVLIHPRVIKDREAYFAAFARFLEELNGRYITAVDSGTTEKDMDIIAKYTKYVTCTSADLQDGGPSYFTALGVRRSIEAAVKFKLNRDSLEGVHVAIQGAGHVGYYLAKELHALGARLTMTDTNSAALSRCAQELGVDVCATDKIYDVAADVFAPCALGAVLNLNTIKRLKASIVAGSANNQLAHHHHGITLHERHILYAPDFVINAGGLIYVAALYNHADPLRARQQVNDLYQTSLAIFERSKIENRSTTEVAEAMALEMLR